MTVARDDVMAALFARLQVAAALLPAATARRNPTLPVDLDRGGVDFTMTDGSPGAPQPEIEPDPPFYMIDEAEIAVTIAESDEDRDAALRNALGILETVLRADQRLGGRLKGRMLWDLTDRDDDAVSGATPDAVVTIAVTLEYESATRLGV